MTIKLSGAGPEIAVVVRDVGPMLSFYRDLLGLELDRERDFPGIHLWWLRCGGGFVKLVCLDATPEAANPEGGLRGASGLRYITLEVDNVEEMARAAAAGGGRLVYSTTLDDLTMAMLEDPEGNHVELVRWR
jgi:catechol 2,3-dioxygenase-like lactoylglutathione lyase family enzyme